MTPEQAFDNALKRYPIHMSKEDGEALQDRFAELANSFDDFDNERGFNELQWAADIFVSAVRSYQFVIGVM